MSKLIRMSPRMGMTRGSSFVRVIADGQLLKLGRDYKIDSNGYITFMTEIGSETVTVETICEPPRKLRHQKAQWKQRHYGPQRR